MGLRQACSWLVYCVRTLVTLPELMHPQTIRYPMTIPRWCLFFLLDWESIHYTNYVRSILNKSRLRQCNFLSVKRLKVFQIQVKNK